MKKLLKIITGVTLSLAMAIGVGIGVASNNKKAEPVYAATDSTEYTLVTSTEDLEANKSYILTNGTTGTVKAAAVTSNANNRKTTEVTVANGRITRGSSVLSFTLGGSSGAWTFLTENYAGTDGYLASATSSNNNYLRVLATNTEENHSATISFSSSAAVITIQPHSTRNIVRFNSTADSNKGCFACYSSGQSAVYLWKEAAQLSKPYTVYFNANGGTGEMSSVPVPAGDYTLPVSGFTAPDGKTFSGWKASNEGVLIAVGGTYNVTADVTFWAQWADITYTVTYNANGGTGTMTDSNSPYASGATVAVLANAFSRSGYEFVKYNTAANGSGQDYYPSGTFAISANTTLYAQWSVIKYPCTDENSQITWDLSIASYDTMTAEAASWTSSKASISIVKGSSSTDVNNVVPPGETHTRFYKNAVMTISPANGYKINSIVFTAPDSSHANTLNNNTWTNATSSADSTDVTVVPMVKTGDVSVTFAAAFRLTQIVINYASSSPLSSIAVSGTYQTSFDQYEAFNHTGMIVTATYEDASTEDVTLAAVWSEPNMSTTGSKTITVSYTEGVTRTTTYTITVSATPFLVPDQDSSSGQVGGNDILTFTYGNLDNPLSVISSATSIVTVGAPEFVDVDEGMVQINFVGSGTTTVLFKDGETQLASVPVTVTRNVYSAEGTIFEAAFGSGITVTSGYTPTSENTADKTSYYQDDGTANSSICSFLIKKESALFSSTPANVKLVARLGSGNAKDLGNNLEACFVDESDNEIAGTKVTIVTHLPKDPDDFTVSIPYSPSAYGLKVTHLKEDKWNVRYYSFKLVYDYGSSIKTLTANEVKDGNGTTTSVNNVTLRFGAKFSTEYWDAFNSEHTITDYGVMFARKTYLDSHSVSSVKAAYETNESLLYVVRRGSGTAPSLSEGNRVFTAYLTLDPSDYNTVFCATPFIVAGGQYYFLEEMRYSVKTLAAECQTTHASPLSDEALAILNA